MKHREFWERLIVYIVVLCVFCGGLYFGFKAGSRKEVTNETLATEVYVESSSDVLEISIETETDEPETQTEEEIVIEAETEPTVDPRYAEDPSLWWCDKNIEIRLIEDGGKLSPSGQDWNVSIEITNLTDEEWTLSSDYMVINGYSIEGGLYEILPPNAITKGTMWFNAEEFLEAADKAETTEARFKLMVVNSNEYSKSYTIELH